MPLYLTVLLSILNQIALKGSKMLVALYAIELDASPLAIGMLISTYALFPLLLAVYAGKVSDRSGVRRPMVLGSFGVSLGLLLPFLVPTMMTLYVSSALIGMASLFFHVSVHNLVGALGDAKARTGNFGTFSLGSSISGFIGPLLVGFIIDHFGYLPAYLSLAAIAIIPGLVLAFYGGFIPPRIQSHPEDRGSGMKDLLGNATLRRTLITGGLIITGIDLYNFYMPIYGRSIGLSASVIGVVLGMQAAAAFVVRLWMPRLAGRYGEHRVLTASLLVAGVTYLAFPMVENAFLLGLISFVLGLGLGCGQPLSIILTYNHSPAGRAGEALGLRLTVNKFTQIVVPLVFGSLGTAAGIFPVFWLNALLLLAGGYLSAEKR
jgi:MFS family permease